MLPLTQNVLPRLNDDSQYSIGEDVEGSGRGPT